MNERLQFTGQGADVGVRIETLTRHVKGSLRGFVNVAVPRWRLRFHDCPFHVSGERRWVGLAAKPQLGRDQVLVRDDKNKVVYAPVATFMDAATRDRFSDACVA